VLSKLVTLSKGAHSAGKRARPVVARTALVSAIVALSIALVPAAASADGDPASDVLVSQTAFVPWDAHSPGAAAGRLSSVVAAAQRAGYPVRVAVIASASDLGSVTQLWRRPKQYAEYLGVELSVAFRGGVVVVMPNGDGAYHAGVPMNAVRAALARRPSQGARVDDLTLQAVAAVERLAAAAGHRLPASASQAPEPTASSASNHAGDWIAFGAGLVLVVFAWVASFRARPFGFPRADPSRTARG
jgi:hypothetical protein